jgi:VIT1/CCC1 family predicted Fe2+/Mn2+ transporter
VLGVAGAHAGPSTVRLAGVAGLLAGAFSMAAGELVSVRAQDELVQREIEVERNELFDEPEEEQRELAAMYRTRGVPAADADIVARILSANHEVALDTHTRLELGIDPDAHTSAGRASMASFIAFGIGALLPLLPWFFLSSTLLSIIIGALAAATLGAVIGIFTGRGVLRTAARQLTAAAIAAGVTYAVGSLLGVHTG